MTRIAIIARDAINSPNMSESDAAILAKRYDFSGGQIENITRKQAVEEILTG